MHYEQTSPTSPVDIFQNSNSYVESRNLSRFENNLKLFNEIPSDNHTGNIFQKEFKSNQITKGNRLHFI